MINYICLRKIIIFSEKSSLLFLPKLAIRDELLRLILFFFFLNIQSQLYKKRKKKNQPLIDCPVENYLYEKSCLSIIF